MIKCRIWAIVDSKCIYRIEDKQSPQLFVSIISQTQLSQTYFHQIGIVAVARYAFGCISICVFWSIMVSTIFNKTSSGLDLFFSELQITASNI